MLATSLTNVDWWRLYSTRERELLLSPSILMFAWYSFLSRFQCGFAVELLSLISAPPAGEHFSQDDLGNLSQPWLASCFTEFCLMVVSNSSTSVPPRRTSMNSGFYVSIHKVWRSYVSTRTGIVFVRFQPQNSTSTPWPHFNEDQRHL